MGSETNSLNSVTISSIPTGATLSNRNGNTLGVSGGSITFSASQIASGYLNGLAITSVDEGNFTLTIAATERDAENNLSATSAGTEFATVADAALSATGVAVTATEGTEARRVRVASCTR